MNLHHSYVETNGISLHVVQAGAADHPLVILLHGFPEYWYGWRRQISALVQAGFRVWIPDQRGYNLSQKPADVAAYSLDELAGDVLGLLAAAEVEQAHVVGHNWGAGVAWWTAEKYPERVQKLAILNVPHHAVMKQHLQSSWQQLKRSWYIFFFQLPWLPEVGMRWGNWRTAVQSLKNSSRSGTFTERDLDRYRRAWSQPGAMTSMLNWYRALFRQRSLLNHNSHITVPTLLIWGAQHQFLGQEMAQPSIDLCDNGRLVFIEEATHWVQHEEPEEVNQLLVQFLT